MDWVKWQWRGISGFGLSCFVVQDEVTVLQEEVNVEHGEGKESIKGRFGL